MYFLLGCDSRGDRFLARVEYRDDDAFRFWTCGTKEELWSEPALPLRARVVTDRQTELAELWQTPLPLMTTRLRHVLETAGVDNIDHYPVVLTDSSGATIDGYTAFYVVGVEPAHVLAARTDDDDAPLLLRVEGDTYIAVHARVKAAIEAAAIDTLTFTPLSALLG